MKAKPSIAAAQPALDAVAFSVRHVAHSLDFHPETIRDYLRKGRIKGFRVGGRWRIRGDVLAALLKDGVPISSN